MARATHEAGSVNSLAGQSHSAPLWRIAGQRASFSASASAPLAGEVDIARPARGIVAQVAGQSPYGLNMLGVAGLEPSDEVATPPADCYERGTDLVLTYAETSTRPLRVQVYWRVHSADRLPAGAAGIDLQVSVQTSLLDADSALWAASTVPARHVARLAGCAGNADCWLFRWPAAEMSYAEMIHPADDRGCVLSREDESQDRWLLRRRLFGERLEKGVILRARLRGVLLPRQDDERLAAAACEAFVTEAPPLTT